MKLLKFAYLGLGVALLVVVPPFYLIRATNGFFAAGGDALFTAKEAGRLHRRQ